MGAGDQETNRQIGAIIEPGTARLRARHASHSVDSKSQHRGADERFVLVLKDLIATLEVLDQA